MRIVQEGHEIKGWNEFLREAAETAYAASQATVPGGTVKLPEVTRIEVT